MVWLGLAGGNDLVPDSRREGDVDQVIAVHVPDLAPTQAKFQSAEAMRP